MASRAELRKLLESAVEIVDAAGPISLRYFRGALEVDDKSGGGAFDPVTAADREVESFIRAEIAARFPDHGIIGEEHGTVRGDSPLCWVIDPIDGTRAFISGVPCWGILLGLTEADECIVGVSSQPYLGETYLGSSAGSRMRRAGRETVLQTRRTTQIESAVLYCTHPDTFVTDADRSAFARLATRVKLMRYGGDCYSYCLLAMGQIDLIIEGSMQPYDIVPLIPIVEGAGGVVSNGEGGPARLGGTIIAAATPELHARALEFMNARNASH